MFVYVLLAIEDVSMKNNVLSKQIQCRGKNVHTLLCRFPSAALSLCSPLLLSCYSPNYLVFFQIIAQVAGTSKLRPYDHSCTFLLNSSYLELSGIPQQHDVTNSWNLVGARGLLQTADYLSFFQSNTPDLSSGTLLSDSFILSPSQHCKC